MKNKKSLFKKIVVIALLIYAVITFINQQKILNNYASQTKAVQVKIEEATEKQQELNKEKENVNSAEYIEAIAREKLEAIGLLKTYVKEENVKTRFIKATLGWIKYKPLLLYITDQETYPEKIKEMRKKIEDIVPKLNKVFSDDCFNALIEELDKYDKSVKQDYEEYKRTNEIWKSLREIIF